MSNPIPAPRDGRVIIVGHPDAGEFAMAWNPTGTNELFAPGEVGIWEAADRSFTWRDGSEYGPSYWMPLEMAGNPLCRQPIGDLALSDGEARGSQPPAQDQTGEST